MGLRITISEIVDDENKAVSEITNDEFGVNRSDEEDENEGAIVLTGHTVTEVRNLSETVPGRNGTQTKSVNAMQINGMFNVADQSKEQSNMTVFFDWHKRPAHDKKAYKRIPVSHRTGGDIEVDNITFDKAFVVSYKEKATNKKGTIEFVAVIRRFDERAVPSIAPGIFDEEVRLEKQNSQVTFM